MKFLEEHRCSINYHSNKSNAVADELSRKIKMARLRIQDVKPVQEVLSLVAEVEEDKIFLRNLSLGLYLRKKIVDLLLSSQVFQDFMEKEMKIGNHEF
jgi:hypothetical protein